MTPDTQLLEALGAVRRHWRRRLLLESAVGVAVAGVVAVVAGLLIIAVLGPGAGAILSVRVVGYLLIAAAVLRFAVLPLVRRVSDERLALYVEERAPELRQALLSAVHELHQPAGAASPSLTAVLMKQAVAGVRPLAQGGRLERPRVRRATRALAGTVLGAGLVFAFGPAAPRDAARLLFAPWIRGPAAVSVFAVDVTPGTAVVPRGGAVDVRASLVGFSAAGAELVFRSDSGPDWIRLLMTPDSTDRAFSSRLFDLTRGTEYYVEAENVRSPVFHLTVSELPAARRIALELRFPAYTHLPAEQIEDGGDVAAVVGTTVVARVTVSKRVRGGSLRFDGGTAVPLTPQSDSILNGSFRVTADGFYRVDLVAEDGRTVPGTVQYAVQALADRAPAVTVTEPGRDTKVTSVEEVAIAVRASDDYGVRDLELRYTINGGAEHRVDLADSAAGSPRELRAAHTFFLEELHLSPGDLIAYHAAAGDGAGNRGLSDVYFLEVRPYSRNYRQAEQAGGGGGGGDSPEGFVSRQRQIVAATFNWLRDSAGTDEGRRRQDLTTVAIAQGRLRQDVSGLVRRLAERGMAQADSTFQQIHRELDSAAAAMQPAEELLGRRLARAALPVEQRALQHLQRAEALYREVQVQLGDNAAEGGGGGGEQNAEDLADLFELETDKLRNQYESVQRESQQTAERQLDEVMERLRQLASRQQQENERTQQQAEALRERMSRQGGGGGGGGGGAAQRELARQAEEEARRLERLARERNDPALADAARRLRETAEAMRRAASGQSAQGNAALEELRRATRELEDRKSTELADGVRRLAERARDLQNRQRDIARDVAGLPTATSEERAEQLRRLSERKDALAADVERLESDADRLSRSGRRDQPQAAAAVAQAADSIRESRVRDKIVFSKGVMAGGSSEYANAFEGQIGEDLNRAAERLRAAAEALTGESAARRNERALESARELVRGLESLRDRIGSGEETGGAGQGAPGDSGQAGSGTPSRTRPGDSRQFTREFRMRREAAQELRRDLARQGIDTRELDRAIGDLRQLESGRGFGDPKNLAQLQATALERLKTFEFMLYRRLGLDDQHRPTLGTPAQVPPGYRALVEEYYRSLGRSVP